MADIHHLPATRNLQGSALTLSDACKSLLASAGYKPIAPSPEKEALATTAVTILAGTYRKDDAALPEIRAEAMIAILAEYPDACIRHVTDPRTGIQSFKYSMWRQGKEVQGPFKSFPPEPGELQEACERFMAPIRVAEERERRAREQAEVRRAEEERWRKTAPDIIAVVTAYQARRAAEPDGGASGLVDALAARIASSIEQAARARRVAEDLDARRKARATA